MGFIERTGDPVQDAYLYDRYSEKLRRRYLRGCPECVECGEPIEDEKCYNMGGFDECMCEACGKAQLATALKLTTALYELVETRLLEMYGDTPHDYEAEEEIA